jgi:hypothetical protein
MSKQLNSIGDEKNKEQRRAIIDAIIAIIVAAILCGLLQDKYCR